jgi:hypothetical protein
MIKACKDTRGTLFSMAKTTFDGVCEEWPAVYLT